ncbi:DUF4382 domain-containing protein [Sorangium sp. So ce1078]|uniref:DUF4382 domain-containing protein n=1 Tax=Sorangium sp. So ce1078 TaxID=3133329 RepID=UPI003F5FCABF
MRAFSSHVGLFGLLAFSIAGCGGGATVEVGVTAQPLQVPLAPPAGGDVASEAHLVVTVTEVSVHIAGDEGSPGGDGESADRAGEKGWTTLFSGEAKVDLLDAVSTEEFLGSNEVSAGKITQVRLVLAGAELVDAAGTSPVSCPSCSESGLKIVTEGTVEVSPGGTLRLTLDVDQASSLTQDESGYRLDPVIKIAQAEER